MIDQYFRELLGRNATAQELQYFNKFIEDGDISMQDVARILQSNPEYQNRLLDKNTDSFGQRLQAGDDQILRRAADVAGAQVNSRFAALGRPVSSAMGASVFGQTGQIANSLAERRQAALLNFYGKGLAENAALAAAQGEGSLNRGYGLRDERRQRGYMISDYYRMKDDHESARQGMSGWNALTPEFLTNGLFQVAAGAAGGMAGRAKAPAGAGGGGGLFSGGMAGGFPSGMTNRYGGYA